MSKQPRPIVSLDIEVLRKEHDHDVRVRPDILDEVSCQTPKSHSKWLGYLVEVRREMAQAKQELDELELHLSLYYTGRANSEAYRIRPFNHKVPKSEVSLWLGGDEKWKAASMNVKEIDAKLEFVIEAIKGLNNVQWAVRNTQQFLAFTQGMSTNNG